MHITWFIWLLMHILMIDTTLDTHADHTIHMTLDSYDSWFIWLVIHILMIVATLDTHAHHFWDTIWWYIWILIHILMMLDTHSLTHFDIADSNDVYDSWHTFIWLMIHILMKHESWYTFGFIKDDSIYIYHSSLIFCIDLFDLFIFRTDFLMINYSSFIPLIIYRTHHLYHDLSQM